MKVQRSVKCYFGSWLTATKQRRYRRFLNEYHVLVEKYIDLIELKVLSGQSKFDIVKAETLHAATSWLTARAKKNACSDAYALIKGTIESSLALKKTYKRPKHSIQMMLSETNASIKMDAGLKSFDVLLRLFCLNGFKTEDMAIPLKRSRHFNEFYLKDGWELAKSVLCTDRYIQFTFKKEVPKKSQGDILGIDPGATSLIATTEHEAFGEGIMALLKKQKLKQRGSKAWWRTRHHIRQYIDKAVKSINYKDLMLIVLEDNRNIKRKSKVKGRLTKNIRSLLSGWAIGRINERIEMLCETNGVRLRRVAAFNNSRTCPCCGSAQQKNRASRDAFKCIDCGYANAADFVGSLNALARFVLGPYGAEFKQLFIAKFPSYRMENFAMRSQC